MANTRNNMRMMLLNGNRGGQRGGNYGGRMNYGGYGRYEDDMENRFRDRRGREHYDNGRYAPRGNYGGDMRMNRIGFDGGYDGYETEDRYDEFYDPVRMGYGGQYDDYEMGGAYGQPMKLSRHDGEEWAFAMKNADGTTGPHWKMEQTNQVMAQKGLKYDPHEFWLAMNASYSDLCEFFKKKNISNMDTYVDYVKAFWFEDEDAGEDKLAKYYFGVVCQ